jgi:pyruvate ferredoxin oxidoreductase alpha subunit
VPRALEGSAAVARAVALCRPGVIAAYPITPQTHIVENISRLVADGELDAELVSVESEFSAASVVLGAAAAGSRAYTASSSQGILLMAEVLYNIAGLRIPLVLSCANRAVGAPLSIWNDQQDSMAVRDAGWIQLYCVDNQQAVDSTVQAFRIAEETELPVMVCMDGFTLTHTMEIVELPTQQQVDRYLPPYRFSRTLDPARPLSIGTLVTPDWYSELRHAHHVALLRAADVVELADRDWKKLTRRDAGGLIERIGAADAPVAVLTIGSVGGTFAAALQECPPARATQLLRLRCFRPFPAARLRELCAGVRELIVVERALSPGQGGILGTEVRAAFAGLKGAPRVHNVAIGLGGRDVPMDALGRLVQAALARRLPEFGIFDLQPERLPAEER